MMKVSSLDAGAARLLQFSLIFVVPARLTKEDLENATRHVAARWPLSNSWIDPLRRHMVRFVLHKGVDILKVKQINKQFKDYVSDLPRAANSNFIDISILDGLFKGWLGVTNINPFERVLTVKVVQFEDNTVIRFKVQHPLTDMGGLLHIVASFCEGLRGTSVEDDKKMIEQSQKRLYRAETGKEAVEKGKAAESEIVLTPQQEADTLHSTYWHRGWFSLIGTGLRIWTSISKMRPRSESMVFLPQKVLDRWMAESKANGNFNTDNDLVMAWIHKCLLKYIQENKLETSPDRAHFAFIMNIEKHLKMDKDELSNPWIVVPVTEDAGADSPILDHAGSIRRSIQQARKKEVIQSILDQHKGLERIPYLPKHHGWTGAPHLVVTSWMGKPLYDFDFSTPGTGTAAAGPPVRPSFVQGSQHIYKLLQQLQISLPGLITTWKGRDGGVWLEGDLEVGLWRELLKLPSS